VSPLWQRFTLEAFCGSHAPQLAAAGDLAPFLHLMCARQSGKTWDDDGIMFDNAVQHPGSTNLFLGLKGTGVKFSNWEPVWKQGVCEKWELPASCHNETQMLTTFPNRSRVMFAGTDDLTNVKKYLGNRLDRGVVIIDEGQDQPDSVLRYILRVLLPPMLTSTSRVILSGVLPDVPAGMFYELAADQELASAPHLQHTKGYSHHEWGRAANVHTPNAMEELAAYIKLHGLSIDDPQIQRDWFMKRVWDPHATAYRYDASRNAYAGPCAPQEWHAVGIDPGTRDRMAVVVWGWSGTSRDVWHVYEKVWPKDARATWKDLATELGSIRAKYRPVSWYYDAGSSQMTIDTFTTDYGIPLIQAAKKSDMPGQVARFSDLLTQGRAHILAGSALEEDLRKTRWDTEARAKGLHRWSSHWHPDVADAARYGLASYYDSYKEPDTRTQVQYMRDAEQERIRLAMEQATSERQGQPSRDQLANVLGFGDG
jgi:hypothetical protein